MRYVAVPVEMLVPAESDVPTAQVEDNVVSALEAHLPANWLCRIGAVFRSYERAEAIASVDAQADAFDNMSDDELP